MLTSANIEETFIRGRELWDSIYEPHADKLYNKLHSYHPDFICKALLLTDYDKVYIISDLFFPDFSFTAAFIMQSYGTVLSALPDSADQQGNLSRTLSSVVGAACLRAEGRVGPQLVSHVFGLLKARHVENKSAEDVWLSSDDGAEWVIRMVDQILDMFAEQEEHLEHRVKL
jgi:hypothetical protein